MAHATRLPSHAPATITADLSGLSEYERETLGLLVEAAKAMDAAYLAQMRIGSLAPSKAFSKPAVPLFYPEDATKAELDDYLATHPSERERLLSPFTAVIRSGESFQAVPYSQVHAEAFERAADLLSQAAARIPEPLTKEYLEKRAEAFRTNEYRESDIAWIHANDSFFELTIGPYESYGDPLFGMKRTFESVLGIIRKEDTDEAAVFQEQIQRFDEALGREYGYASAPSLTPMVVIDEVWAAGESLYEYVPMAYNLPNDPDIHTEVGSKKVFIKNVMDAKMRLMTEPIGERVLNPRYASSLDIETVLFFVLGHEAAHGLSFRFDGEYFGSVHSSAEECKADVFGILFLYFLYEQGRFETALLNPAVITHVIDCIRQVRFGLHEAHGAGALVQLNWLIRQGTLTIHEGKFWFSPLRFRSSFQSLGNALYALSQTKSEQAAKDFMAEWAGIPEGLETIVESLADIPTDIDPQFAL